MAAPGGSGPIGPYPPGVSDDAGREDYDRLRRRMLWTLPYGLYVIGSRSGEQRNAMTLNWASQVSFEPKLVGIGVEKTAWTHELISAGRTFSICTVAREDRAIVRKFTKPVEFAAGEDIDGYTLNGFVFHDGLTGSPILDQAPGYMDCEVRQAVDTGGHTFFIGEVMDTAFQRDEDTEVLRMEDTRMNYGG